MTIGDFNGVLLQSEGFFVKLILALLNNIHVDSSPRPTKTEMIVLIIW